MTLNLGLLLADARRRITPISSSASLDAQLLMAETLDVNRAYVLAHPERELTLEQAAQFEALVVRRTKDEPIAYIRGWQPFYDRHMIVTPDVLIPRPETEHLLEESLKFIDDNPVKSLVDVGTGSGALAVTLAALRPQVTVYATDISPRALALARQNADVQNVNVAFYEGDLLQPLIEREICVDLIVANLPYIASHEIKDLDVSKYEPVMALDGGGDGLELIRRLTTQAPEACCKGGGGLLLEIGANQGQTALTLFEQTFGQGSGAEVCKDYAGHDRIVRARIVQM